MDNPSEENIQQATEKVKRRLPLEDIRCITKYKDISEEDYHQLIKNAESFALLILEAFFSKEQGNI